MRERCWPVVGDGNDERRCGALCANGVPGAKRLVRAPSQETMERASFQEPLGSAMVEGGSRCGVCLFSCF